MISSTSSGSFVGYTANESPTSKLKPHPVRSSSKWRVSFADSGPLRRRLTTRRAGKGFARVYRVAATVAAAPAVASIIATLVAVIRQRRKFHPSFPIARVGQTSMARSAAAMFSRRSYPCTTVQGGSGVVCLVYLPFLQALSGDFGRHQEQYAAGLCGGQFSSAFLKQSRNLLAV